MMMKTPAETPTEPPYRDYEASLEALNSTQLHGDNLRRAYRYIEHYDRMKCRKLLMLMLSYHYMGKKSARRATMEAMRVYLQRLGLMTQDSDTGLERGSLAKIPTLHVTGSKGKGSTCAFVEAILRQQGLKTGKDTSSSLLMAYKISHSYISVYIQCSSPLRTWSV